MTRPSPDQLQEAADVLPADAVVAIDGPAGSGKSTTAKAVAKRLGLTYIDSGAMYRALTRAALDAGVAPGDEAALTALADDATLDLRPGERESVVLWNGRDVSTAIRTPEVDANVSEVSAHGAVRQRMVERQRQFGRHRGVVMEGRDIGSVVFPLATAKIYLDASPEARAERRWRQFRERGQDADRAEVLQDLLARDRLDSGRDESPLTISPDALVLDSSDWSLERQLDEVVLACRVNPWLDRRLDWDVAAARRACSAKYRLFYDLFDVVGRLFGRREFGRPAATIPPGVIIASNHVSWYDPPLVGGRFNRGPIHTLAKEELFVGPVGRAFFRWLDAIPINRRGYDEQAFDEARRTLAAGHNLFIFPEGTRRVIGDPGPVRGGLGILAQETGAPILPVFLRGTSVPEPGGNPQSPLELWFGPVVRLHALDRLRRDLDPKEITQRVGDMYLAMIRELQARSFARTPLTAFERALAERQRRRIAAKRPFDKVAD